MPDPLCFVVMPFGQKADAGGRVVDFDRVFRELISPAIIASGMEPLRADQEQFGGVIHKPMFERLILCDYALADLTTANANVFYECGVRHALRPASTVLIFEEDTRLPFDVAPLRAFPYSLTAMDDPALLEIARSALSKKLRDSREMDVDSPLYQLVEGMPIPDIKRLKTDSFRDQVDYSRDMKRKLADARKEGRPAIDAVRDGLGDLKNVEAGVLVDLFLSYRAIKNWESMVDLSAEMPRPLANSVMICEQRALALNRIGRDAEAEALLHELLEERGPSSETFGILGRIYKDRWAAATKAADTLGAKGHLKQAIHAYKSGFETDWRDAYPGVNAVTLMELADPPDPERESLLPVVTYAVERRIATGAPDYWDHATLLELSVLQRKEGVAEDALADALAKVREVWEPETTANNLKLIRETRAARNQEWLPAEAFEKVLIAKAKPIGQATPTTPATSHTAAIHSTNEHRPSGSSAYAAALQFVLRWEGGFVDDPDDRGGRTNKGVTQSVYDTYRRQHGLALQDVLEITDAEVSAIYHDGYWLQACCDELRNKLDLAQFDTAVNMGPNRAARILQTAVRTTVDGIIGPITLAAAEAADLGEALTSYCEIREGLYRTFAKAPRQEKFLRGWLNRLNDLRRELGLPGFEITLERAQETATTGPRIPDLPLGAELEDWRQN